MTRKLLIVLSFAIGSGGAAAEEKPASAKASPVAPGGIHSAAPEGARRIHSAAPNDEKAQMEAWMAVATPGRASPGPGPLEGTWDTRSKIWTALGASPQESGGVSVNRMILGGRFLEQRFKGDMMGQSFEGFGVTGYDNYKKKYLSTWVDNLGTTIMLTEGTPDASGKVITSISTVDDFVSRQSATIKTVTTLVDADHTTYEMWQPGPDGAMFKSLEVLYTRRK